MNSHAESLEQLIDAHLSGRPMDVPPGLRAEFDQALAAHGALRGLLDETLLYDQTTASRLPPDVSDHYDIERELGRGGMGVVYLARQRSLNRRVALKVLRPGERTFGPLVQRFLDEAQHLAQLRHPNIVSIHEVGDAAGEPYFTMDYIDGETLSAVIARGPLSPTRAVAILKQVAAAIQHAHRQGIIHRDLKPGNVLLDHAGQVFVTDFGLARNVSQESSLTQSGELLGTPQYMSPEQARGQTSLIGEATDIHALGLLLFEMLARRAAFGASSPADVLVKLLNQDPPPLRTLDRRIPRDLETICLKALQKSPAARYANVSAMLEDLRRYEAGEPLLARRTSLALRAARWIGRRWKIAATVLVTAGVVAVVAPRLFDKSVEDLVAWGDEELKNGNPDIAVQIFQRAWSRSDPAQRSQLLPNLTNAIQAMNDSKQAVEAALKVIELSPAASFGKHDFVVAQTLALAARAETENGFFESPHDPNSRGELAKRELAARRLTLFLEGGLGTREERAEAERTLQAIDRSLRSVRPVERWSGDEVVRLPEIGAEELAARTADTQLSLWERGKAALALGRVQEAAHDMTSALTAYHTALDHLRKVFPFVEGVAAGMPAQALKDPNFVVDAPECRLLRELLESLHRLDPQSPLTATGGLRLRFDRPELLNDVQVAVKLAVWDPAIANPHSGLSRNLASYVPVHGDEPRKVKILPGTYQLHLAGTMTSWDSPAGRDAVKLLDITAPQWPKNITIGDEWIDLSPLVVRRLSAIKLIKPADLARIDLKTDSLTWEPVPDAAYYEVALAHFSDVPHPTSTYFQSIRTTEPTLKPSRLLARDQQTLRQNWTVGRTAGYYVQAFNADGQRLATTLDERRFLIASPLPSE